jgi:hypothetical protein
MDQTHALARARVEAWKLEERLWLAPGPDTVAGDLALLRERKEQIRTIVDQRKQLGFPLPDGCESWWTEYEVHRAPRPSHLPAAPDTRR